MEEGRVVTPMAHRVRLGSVFPSRTCGGGGHPPPSVSATYISRCLKIPPPHTIIYQLKMLLLAFKACSVSFWGDSTVLVSCAFRKEWDLGRGIWGMGDRKGH